MTKTKRTIHRFTLRMTEEQYRTVTARAREWQSAAPGSRSLNDWILTQLLRPTLHHLDEPKGN